MEQVFGNWAPAGWGAAGWGNPGGAPAEARSLCSVAGPVRVRGYGEGAASDAPRLGSEHALPGHALVLSADNAASDIDEFVQMPTLATALAHGDAQDEAAHDEPHDASDAELQLIISRRMGGASLARMETDGSVRNLRNAAVSLGHVVTLEIVEEFEEDFHITSAEGQWLIPPWIERGAVFPGDPGPEAAPVSSGFSSTDAGGHEGIEPVGAVVAAALGVVPADTGDDAPAVGAPGTHHPVTLQVVLHAVGHAGQERPELDLATAADAEAKGGHASDDGVLRPLPVSLEADGAPVFSVSAAPAPDLPERAATVLSLVGGTSWGGDDDDFHFRSHAEVVQQASHLAVAAEAPDGDGQGWDAVVDQDGFVWREEPSHPAGTEHAPEVMADVLDLFAITAPDADAMSW
ncbi:MAG: hypothetical protein CMP09_13655 [Yangia sp.]|nr:hypothetical protein [Salipiger sp.]